MTATYLGSYTLGGAMPGAAAIGLAGANGISLALPDLMGRLAALLAYTPTPIDFAAQISTLQATITGIQASITLGIPAPSLAEQIAALAALVADLQGVISGLTGSLALITAFQTTLAAAGVHLIAFDGPVSAHGAELDSKLALVPGISAGDPAHALTLITTIPATWAALASVLKVTP